MSFGKIGRKTMLNKIAFGKKPFLFKYQKTLKVINVNTAKKPLAGKETIQEYIPQRAPIVMVDELLSCNEQNTQTCFTAGADNLFSQDGQLREPGLIEHMAQSAAAGVGYAYISQNKPVPLGYIGAVQRLQVQQLPKITDTLETTIETMHEVMTTKVIRATTICQGVEIATCEMKIFLDESGEK